MPWEFTPAEIEQLCAEFDSIDNFLCAIEERVRQKHTELDRSKLSPEQIKMLDLDTLPSSPVPLKRSMSSGMSRECSINQISSLSEAVNSKVLNLDLSSGVNSWTRSDNINSASTSTDSKRDFVC